LPLTKAVVSLIVKDHDAPRYFVERLFAVIRSRGAAWNDALPLEEQEDWRPHGDFMDALLRLGQIAPKAP
jgi:hypothetical protein